MVKFESDDDSTNGDDSVLNKAQEEVEPLIPRNREENNWYNDCNMHLKLKRVKVHSEVVEGVLDKERVRLRKLKVNGVWLARMFKKMLTKSVLKVFHVGTLRDGHYVITEPVVRFEDWVRNNQPIDNSGKLKYDKFILPFRSLLENVLSILHEKGDFMLDASNIVAVRREKKIYELKVGIIELRLLGKKKAKSKDVITCLHDLCKIVETWIGAPGAKRCRGLYLLFEDMKSLQFSLFIPNRVHHLYFLLKHPLFIESRKGEMFDLICKVDWLRRMAGVKIIKPEQFTSDLIGALNAMEFNCGRTPHLPYFIRKNTIWFNRAYSNNTFNGWFHSVLNGYMGSKFLTLRFVIRSLRNLWAHLDQNIASGDSIESCIDTMDKFCPGFWYALHHAVLTSMLFEDFMEGRWFFSLKG